MQKRSADADTQISADNIGRLIYRSITTSDQPSSVALESHHCESLHQTVLLTSLRPQVFSNDGQFKMRFGVRGRSPGQLQRPTGVSVDLNGDIVVADYDNRWVSIFSSDGKFKVTY